MTLFNLISIIFSIAVGIGYVNYRFIKMPTTIAIMCASLLLSLCLIILGRMGYVHLLNGIASALEQLDFHTLLMGSIINFLLFAGALTVDINDLKRHRWEVTILATLGTLVSTFLIGTGVYYILQWVQLPMSYNYCLLFGALISPTDPIAVLALFKQLGVPRSLSIMVEGESLFNDGVGIVVFLTLYQLTFAQHTVTWQGVSLLFLQEAIGGIAFGLAMGLLAYWLIKPIQENIKMEILITLIIATGGYRLANYWGLSGPLAMVVAGIFIGNRGKSFHMSKQSRETLFHFWEVVDEVLNALLFLLIGLELLVLHLSMEQWVIGVIAIPLVLLVRSICVAVPMSWFQRSNSYAPHTVKIMIWGGLRGGLAVGLALALPDSTSRDMILMMTYSVVVFAILVQGLTIKPLIKHSLAKK